MPPRLATDQPSRSHPWADNPGSRFAPGRSRLPYGHYTSSSTYRRSNYGLPRVPSPPGAVAVVARAFLRDEAGVASASAPAAATFLPLALGLGNAASRLSTR